LVVVFELTNAARGFKNIFLSRLLDGQDVAVLNDCIWCPTGQPSFHRHNKTTQLAPCPSNIAARWRGTQRRHPTPVIILMFLGASVTDV